jgi:hypothetical protein
MAQVVYLLPDSHLVVFSTLKYLNSYNFQHFRNFFRGTFKKGFICKANTFGNVLGDFFWFGDRIIKRNSRQKLNLLYIMLMIFFISVPRRDSSLTRRRCRRNKLVFVTGTVLTAGTRLSSLVFVTPAEIHGFTRFRGRNIPRGSFGLDVLFHTFLYSAGRNLRRKEIN